MEVCLWLGEVVFFFGWGVRILHVCLIAFKLPKFKVIVCWLWLLLLLFCW